MKRREARRLNLIRYFTNKPCKNGHVSERFTSSGGCVDCVVGKIQNWRVDNRDEHNRKNAEYAKKHPWMARARVQKYRASKANATPTGVDRNELKAVYQNCPDGFQVDHIIPLKGKNVCGLHVPYNLQYLTPQDNQRKSNKLSCG